MNLKGSILAVRSMLNGLTAAPSKRRQRQAGMGHPETLEVRALQTMTLGAVVSQFDDGMLRLRRNVPEVADDAFSGDLPRDTPLIQENLLMSDKRFVNALSQFFRGNITGATSIQDATSRLQQFGYTVQYLGLTPNAQGDYLKMTKSMQFDPSLGYSASVKDLNGLSYFNRATMDVSGSMSGNLGELSGTITIGLDTQGIYLTSQSRITAQRLSLSGSLRANGTLGVLQNVSMSGSVTLSGRIEMTLKDQDRDGKIRPADLRQDEVVVGKMTARVRLDNLRFNSAIPWITNIAWSGSVSGDMNDNVMSSRANLNVPQYSTIVSQLDAGFVRGIRNLPWVQRLEDVLNKKVPFTNKTMGQIVGFDSLVDKGISELTGVQLISGADKQSAAMLDLVSGREVTLLSFSKSGSKALNDLKVVPEFQIISEDILPGLISIDVTASVTANASFDYSISAGIGSRGFWIGDTTTVGLGAGIYGNLKGEVKVFGYGLLEGKGSLGIVGTAYLQITDPTPGDGKVYVTDIAVSPSDVPRNLLPLVSYDYKVDLHAKMSAKLAGIKVWDKERKIATIFERHEGPRAWRLTWYPRQLIRNLWE